jgi:hypothetical protein
VPRALGDSLDCPGIPGKTVNEAVRETGRPIPFVLYIFSWHVVVITRSRGQVVIGRWLDYSGSPDHHP